MSVVVTSSGNLTTHILRIEIDQKDIRVVWSKQIWETDYVQAKSWRHQYSVLSGQSKDTITHILRVEDVSIERTAKKTRLRTS